MAFRSSILKTVFFALALITLASITYLKFYSKKIGDVTDEYNGVKIYYNGFSYAKSYGNHYSDDGFYYGKKWQCVEFVKRYYHDYLHHHMPDGMGHAKDFFDKQLKSGKLNKRRNLYQFENGSNVKPAINDILVFDGSFGHVCIISSVNKNSIEVVQQNILGKPRETFELQNNNNHYKICSTKKILGWLRKP